MPCSRRRCSTASCIMPPWCRSRARATGSRTSAAPASWRGRSRHWRKRQRAKEMQSWSTETALHAGRGASNLVGQFQVADLDLPWVTFKLPLTAFEQDGLAAPEIDMGGREVAQALVVAAVIVVADEGVDLGLE